MQKKRIPEFRVPRIRPEYPGIHRVVIAPYSTQIWSCTIQVLLVSGMNIKIPESVSEKRVFGRQVYPTCLHTYLQQFPIPSPILLSVLSFSL
jgi:hypothetical protein